MPRRNGLATLTAVNAMHEMDYQIHGDAMQFVELKLDPMKAAVAEAGGMMCTDKIKSALFGGEGLCFATLRGPGKIWLQPLPLSRLANRIVAAVTGLTRGGREEGPAPGGIGRLLGGGYS